MTMTNANSTLVFTHHSFDEGDSDGVTGRHPAAPNSLPWSFLNGTSIFHQDHKVVDEADQVAAAPQKHRRRLRKRDGTAAAAFLVPLAVEISHENFIIRSSKAEQGAAPLSLETFPNYWVSQKYSDF